MAQTNHERVGKALDLLKHGLIPFVEREFTSLFKTEAYVEAIRYMNDDRNLLDKTLKEWDVAPLLKLMWDSWNNVFKRILGHSERTLVSELREVRNKWAHQEAFSSDDAYRALDSATRLLLAVSAPEAQEVDKIKMELLRVRFDEQARAEKRKSASTAIETQATGNLKPWREVITPHKDVASGRYQQAEFAADLWQVHLGEGSDEYRNPVEFFRRTFLTASLNQLLACAIERLSGKGGDPVVQLQTNFGGGKTHSMLALYHLFSGINPTELAGIDTIMTQTKVKKLPPVNRVVLVGNKISPGNPIKKSDGTLIRTLWGEIAWQLGGKKAFERIKADDEKATNPGDALRELFNEYGPCLILIDEWVAYARQLHEKSDLPAGSFETQFSFAQTLTESTKLAKDCLLVISLPASDTTGSPHAQADDTEVGGQRGRDALDRLHNVIGRLESSWRPATAEEGFEIVRRRLFEPLVERSQFVARDNVAREFFDLYRTQHQEFPSECRDGDYEKRMKSAYPIHPEVFDRLYTDWSTLAKFQRTRGVLRLMASVIHSLWEKGDRNPLILPSNIPIDDMRVQSELTHYLSDNWVPIIEKDVDGPSSLPLRLDGEVPNLGKFHACRRVARAIYMGSAPLGAAAHRGIEDRRVKLGCVMPGESPAIFGDALRRLASTATYLYQDGSHYWYSIQPTVTKLADDRAELFKRDTDKVLQELDKRLRVDLRKTGDFNRIHILPHSGQDVPDMEETRLVVLGTNHSHVKEKENPAVDVAKGILEMRGNTPRLYRNTLVFLAIDKVRLQDLDDAVRRFLAWESIIDEKEKLNLSPNQVKQAETQRDNADTVVSARLPEAYQWLLVPTQGDPHADIEWEVIRLSGQDALAIRASKKLKSDELLVLSFGATRLRMELDRIPLWRGDHVEIRQVVEDFARYLYLPRLKDPSVLLEAIRSGLPLVSWDKDSFAYADSYDEKSERYRGLRVGENVPISDSSSSSLLVKPEKALMQLQRETVTPPSTGTDVPPTPSTEKPDQTTPEEVEEPKPKRFYGSVSLDPARVGRDASTVANEVISHLVGLVGSEVTVTLEISAKILDGTPDDVVRTVTENSKTLKFNSFGFERE